MDTHGNEKGGHPDIEVGKGGDAAMHLEHVDGLTTIEEWKQLREDAIKAEQGEHRLTVKDAFRLYPKAIFWSFCISLCIVQYVGRVPFRGLVSTDLGFHREGYDTACEYTNAFRSGLTEVAPNESDRKSVWTGRLQVS